MLLNALSMDSMVATIHKHVDSVIQHDCIFVETELRIVWNQLMELAHSNKHVRIESYFPVHKQLWEFRSCGNQDANMHLKHKVLDQNMLYIM